MRSPRRAKPLRRLENLADLPVPPDTAPMEAKLVEALPAEPGWAFEPKWDGFRCLAFRAGDAIDLRAKSGKPLTRYFPEIAAVLRALAPRRFVLDGELVVPAEGTLSFDTLQLRIHPAESRVTKLAAETPALFILFDLLMTPRGRSLLGTPFRERRGALEEFYAALEKTPQLRLSPVTRDLTKARAWLGASGGALDGVMAKRCDHIYHPGERAMLKVKPLRTADCVVGGFRYLERTPLVGSLLLGLYDEDGKLDHVGFTATITNDDRPALTRRLEKLVAPPGFTGNAPGGPSRWSKERSTEWQPLKPKLVVEVRYDQITGGGFRHGTTLLRWRPDKARRHCTFEQLAPAMRTDAARKLLRV